MKNLVTGATGFIGSHIAERLKSQGEEVTALVRKTSNTKFLESIGVNCVLGDINDLDSLYPAAKGMDRVYHSAALADEWISKKEAFRVNVQGTRNILEAAKSANVQRFLFVSSLAVLGMKDHHKTPADAPYEKSGDNYIDTKIDAEQLVLEYHRNLNLPVTVVRPGFVFGPRDYKFIPRVLEKLSKGKFMFVGDGKNKINAVYIENLTGAIISAAKSESAPGKAYNVTNDSNLAVKEFIFKIADTWNLKKPSKHIPKSTAYLICNILEGWARMTHSKTPPYITKTRIKFLSLNLDFDIQKTRQELGYTPTIDIDEGLRRTRQWLTTIP